MPNKAAKGFGTYSELLESQQQAQQQPYQSFSSDSPVFIGTPKNKGTELERETGAERENRWTTAAKRLEEGLANGTFTQEQYDTIRLRMGLDSIEQDMQMEKVRRPRK